MRTIALLVVALASTCHARQLVPVVRVTGDDTVITASCAVEIPQGLVIPDANGDGVIHVRGQDITINFLPGSVLRGAPEGTPWETLTGEGVSILDARGVTIQNAAVSGFKVAIHAERADGLRIDGARLMDNFRQRLRSTPEAEDGADWMSPHRDDNREWITNYGAAVYVRQSRDVEIHGVLVRRGQNGILLHRVEDSRIFDNDCSFLSGWGLGLYRSSRNVITRNALDFCVRGHSEGVYNRGQDSAGIVCFEQSSGNTFAQNSVTHGGDGFFAFAGLEAIGESWWNEQRAKVEAGITADDIAQARNRLAKDRGEHWKDPTKIGEGTIRTELAGERIVIPPEVLREYSRRGCNDNLLIDNDFSYAPAHGIELTFSHGNAIVRNRVVENAICGVWGGYSRDTLIAGNTFEANGGMAYGLERGAINMEHASGNRIIRNTLINNRCGVHLWWDRDVPLLWFPGVRAGYQGVSDNLIAANTVAIDANHPFRLGEREKLAVVQLRDDSRDKANVRDNTYALNKVHLSGDVGVELMVGEGVGAPTRIWDGPEPTFDAPDHEVLGVSRPVGARPSLRGRHMIVMDEYGPWDHEGVLIRPRALKAGSHVYEMFGATGVQVLGPIPPGIRPATGRDEKRGCMVVTVTGEPGVHPYDLVVMVNDERRHLRGTLISAAWNVRAFAWTPDVDPREKLDAWRTLAEKTPEHTLDALRLPFGWGGPRDQIPQLRGEDRPIGADRFGLIATSSVTLRKGRWKLSTLSDDGVRVTVNGESVIDNWTWHGPTRNEGLFDVPADGPVSIVVEYFEIDGYSVLELDLEPSPATPGTVGDEP